MSLREARWGIYLPTLPPPQAEHNPREITFLHNSLMCSVARKITALGRGLRVSISALLIQQIFTECLSYASPSSSAEEMRPLFSWDSHDVPWLFFFFFFFMFIFGCVGSSPLCEGPLQLRRVGATLHRGARASHYRGLSCCGAEAPDAQAQ